MIPRQPLVLSTHTIAYQPVRCRCDRCRVHDDAIALEARQRAQEYTDRYRRERNYLEPDIARLDQLIETLRKHAA